MNPLEWTAFTLGVVNVALVVRRSVWNFPFGIAMVSLYAIVFWRERLYSDTLLQGFFVVVNLLGWRLWLANRDRAGEVIVETMPARDRMAWGLGGLVVGLGWGLAMSRWTDAAYPWWDAAIATGSVAAQLMMARRLVENWIVWITVDVASIGLYAAKGLWPTAVLYMILLMLSTWGWMDWRAVRARGREAGPAYA